MKEDILKAKREMENYPHFHYYLKPPFDESMTPGLIFRFSSTVQVDETSGDYLVYSYTFIHRRYGVARGRIGYQSGSGWCYDFKCIIGDACNRTRFTKTYVLSFAEDNLIQTFYPTVDSLYNAVSLLQMFY